VAERSPISELPAGVPADWPNAGSSGFASIEGVNVHYQLAGRGPVLLALHGTAASTHSWRDLVPMLATDLTVLAPDLPGHGFSAAPPPGGYSPSRVARLVSGLLETLGLEADAVLAHSAGAAVAAQMILDGLAAPRDFVALNPALLPPFGLQLPFRLLARGCADSSWLPDLVARRARAPDAVPGLLRGIGSRLGADGIRLYTDLMSRPEHVRGALRLMAEWDLDALAPRLKHLDLPMLIVSGGLDAAVPRRVINRLRVHLPRADYVELDAMGHLAHEEQPTLVAKLIRQRLRTTLDLDSE
jgi:magnesium chelatase accessory protein